VKTREDWRAVGVLKGLELNGAGCNRTTYLPLGGRSTSRNAAAGGGTHTVFVARPPTRHASRVDRPA
jgi:hypothetical protein